MSRPSVIIGYPIGLKHRLLRLEDTREEACPECRSTANEPKVFHLTGDDEQVDQEWCSRCSRHLVLELTFDDQN